MHAPVQHVRPAAHAGLHSVQCPPTQAWFAGQMFPHAPQSFGSVSTIVQTGGPKTGDGQHV
jgi:hypothetical protein